MTPRQTFLVCQRLKSFPVRFGGVTALNDLRLGVSPEEIVSLIGSNRGGNSTAVNAPCGLAAMSRDPRRAGHDEDLF